MSQPFTFIKNNIQFNRNELAGSFGDIGTDLPLIVAMIMVTGINSASVFIVYGIMQLFSGIFYGIPMAVQPLKAVATIVIAQKLSGDIVFGGGLAIGLIMLVFSFTGIIKKLATLIPKVVVRGVQIGLGFSLALIAVKEYIVPKNQIHEIALTIVAFLLAILFVGNRKYPAAVFIILIGVVYAFVFTIPSIDVFTSVKVAFPTFHVPEKSAILQGLLILALPQIPLSLGNSILASEQLSHDLFPQKKISATKIAITYSFMNIVSSFFCGIPVCHGSGGMAGHYSFGARTGGSVVIYGILFLILGLFFSQNFNEIIQIFPIQILGVILFFESLTLVGMVRYVSQNKKDILIAMFVALCAVTMPYGYLIGMVVGSLLYYNANRIQMFKE